MLPNEPAYANRAMTRKIRDITFPVLDIYKLVFYIRLTYDQASSLLSKTSLPKRNTTVGDNSQTQHSLNRSNTLETAYTNEK